MKILTEYNVRFIYTAQIPLTFQQQEEIETNLNNAGIFGYATHTDDSQACAVCDLVDQGASELEAKAIFIKAVQTVLDNGPTRQIS